VIGRHRGGYAILAETPPLGGPHRWLDPAGIADFDGDRKTDIALVRRPHVVGSLELWSFSDGHPQKRAEIADFANHIAGPRAILMAAQVDFDGDGIPDLALSSLDRGSLRIVSFAPAPHEIARVALPAKAATNPGLIAGTPPRVALGLANGTLALVTRRCSATRVGLLS